MKLIIKIILIAGVVAVAAPYFIKGPDGTPLMSWPDVFNRDFSLNSVQEKLDIKDLSAPLQSSDGSEGQSVSEESAIYRWKDENGQWHVSDRRPAGQYETVAVNAKQNLIKSVAKKVEPETESDNSNTAQDTSSKVKDETADTSIGLTTVSPEQIPKLIEDAKKLQQMLQQRKLQQDQASDGL